MSTHNDHGVGRTSGVLRGSILAQGAFVLALGVAAEVPAQEFAPLGDLDGGLFNSSALDVSADGTVVVGIGTSASGREAFRWTDGGGMVGLGDLDGGGFFSGAFDVSADGAVVVGFGISASGTEAFRWTAGGMVGLGDLDGGGFFSGARGVSADGAVVVGFGTSASGTEAFRWTVGGMVGLGDLDGGDFQSVAHDASSDGTVIVGVGTVASGREPFIWTEADGMQSVFQLLEDDGIDLGGWSEGFARGTSDDGSVIVGSATNPDGNAEAWLARLGDGIEFPDDLMASARTLPEAARAMEFGGSSASGALLGLAINNGCGERKGAAEGRSFCIYGAGDGQLLLDDPEDGVIGALSAGILFAGPDTLRFGGGPVVLAGSADLESDGSTDFWGVGGGVFLGYGAYEGGPQFYASGTAYYVDADIDRTYSNGNGRDKSSGSPSGYGISAEAQAGYRFAAGGGARVTPFANFRLSRLSLDGYTESGGGFPAEFDDFDSTRTSVRLGLEGRFRASESADLIATGAWGTGLSASGDNASGSVTGLMDIGAPGLDEEDDWVEGSIGALVSSGRSQVSVSLGGRVGTNGDSGAIFSRLAVSW